MADVFLSYAREDQERVRPYVAALEASGWAVWWDDHLDAGDRWSEEIERNLNAAKCVVVFWSTASRDSLFVREEAQAAADRNVLVNVRLDVVDLPFGVRSFQSVDLLAWQGDVSHAAFVKLAKAVSKKLRGRDAQPAVAAGPVPGPARSPSQFPPPAPEPPAPAPVDVMRLRPRNRRPAVLAAVGVAIVVLASALLLWTWFEPVREESPVLPEPGPHTGPGVPTGDPAEALAPNDADAKAQIQWLVRSFGRQAREAVSTTPFTPELLVAIAYAESGHLWGPLTAKGWTADRVLGLCVGDTLDGPARTAFPINRAALLSEPQGDRMFAIARERLEELAKQFPQYQAVANKPDKFAHGFGLFQRDLQWFQSDPNFFLSKAWQGFETSARVAVDELRRAQARAGLGDRTSLTAMEQVHVAIAYRSGGFEPSKGLKQGPRDAKSRFYGERMFDYLRIAEPMFRVTRSVTGIGPVFAPVSGAVTRSSPPNAAVLNEPGGPTRTGNSPTERARELLRIIDWLDVEKSPRYQARDGRTYPNIYAVDYASQAGVYLPRVWWTPVALERLQQGESVTPRLGSTIEEMRTNDLARWLKDYGTRFGWRRVNSLDVLQAAANEGHVALICARRTEETRSGHIALVVPEGAAKAVRAAGKVTAPVQSQAGAVNFRYRAGQDGWYSRDDFAEYGFWVHE